MWDSKGYYMFLETSRLSFIIPTPKLLFYLTLFKETLSHAKLNREFHFKFEKMSVSDMVNFR